MLYFLVFGQHMYTVRVFQQHTGADYLRVLPYEELDGHVFGHNDVVIFCDIDRCNDAKLASLVDRYSTLHKAGCRILNNPNRVRRRYSLARGLFADRTNQFQVYRPGDLPPGEAIQFPVFVRNELDHDGPSTELIHNEGKLREVLAEGVTPNPLVCEYIDTTFNGYFHKYGAFILGAKIIPRHFFLSRSWNVKNASGQLNQSKQPEVDYILENPHADELRRIAAFAHIEFGRIDYAVTDHGIQVFEINTNPTLIDHHDVAENNPRSFVTHHFIKTISDEFKHLAGVPGHD